MGKKRILTIMLVITLFFSMFTTMFLNERLIIFSNADPGEINQSWNNETTLNVTVLHLQPRINWYDFQYNQSGTWVTKLNTQIDVNNSAEYRFVVNISSDYGWVNISYVNITAWFDNGDEASKYNDTVGGNMNLFLMYENTTGTPNWSLQWPDDEVVEGYYTETEDSDPFGSPGDVECHNLTFSFVPSYQFRHAPGNGSWNDGPGYNDAFSWNFNITAETVLGYKSYDNPVVGETVDEFGVYTYTEIISAGWPTIIGNPGTTAIANSNITIQTRSNGNYSLSVDLDQLDHTTNPAANMPNTTVSLRGGALTSVTPFPGTGPLYLYGADTPTYQAAENSGTSKSTSDVEYRIAIPLAQYPGTYTGTIHYGLKTQN